MLEYLGAAYKSFIPLAELSRFHYIALFIKLCSFILKPQAQKEWIVLESTFTFH